MNVWGRSVHAVNKMSGLRPGYGGVLGVLGER